MCRWELSTKIEPPPLYVKIKYSKINVRNDCEKRDLYKCIYDLHYLYEFPIYQNIELHLK